MIWRWPVIAGVLVAAMGGVTGQPPPEIPENVPGVSPFVPGPSPSTVQPFVVPPSAPSAGPPLPQAPPAPALSMLVLVPQDIPPNQPIPYTIHVANRSSADASKVRVRMPLPEGTTLVSSEPAATPNGTELIWDLKSLPRGETRKIELKLKATGVSEVTAKAYVSYEFGQAVKTRLSVPKLKVTTELPREATTADEAIWVRVRVVNDGRVPVEHVKLTETISDGFEFHRDSDGERTASPLTRTWDLGTIPAGMGKAVEFRVLAKTARELLVRSNVDAGGIVQDSHESKVKIQDAKLKVELRGDPQAQDDTATYRVTVRNEGTTPLTNVRLIGSVPQDCRVTSRTNGGQIGRESVQWIIPKIAPGDAYAFRWSLRSATAGRKTIRADAISDRGLKDTQDVQTLFAGAAAVTWEQKFEPVTVPIDRSGMFTIKVTNNGIEPAKGARVVVTLPSQVSFVQATPKYVRDGDKVIFELRDVPGGGTEVFSITFRGEQPGQAYFTAKLSGEGFADKPLIAEKYVQITTGR